jgi:hypothetical protein
MTGGHPWFESDPMPVGRVMAVMANKSIHTPDSPIIAILGYSPSPSAQKAAGIKAAVEVSLATSRRLRTTLHTERDLACLMRNDCRQGAARRRWSYLLQRAYRNTHP